MGAKLAADRFDLADRELFRARLHACGESLRRMLAERRFDGPRESIGLEVELSLADRDGAPRMVNDAVLARMATRDFQTELGQFTLEFNMTPRTLPAGCSTTSPRNCVSPSAMPTRSPENSTRTS